MSEGAEPQRIKIRCTERVRKLWTAAAGRHDMTYGEFAKQACLFIKDNEDKFREYVKSEGRSRERGRK